MRVSMRLAAAMVLVAAVVLSGGGQVRAQQTAKPEAPPPVPLKVTVSISRFEGEKRTANLPFVLWVNTGGNATIQMGSDVPLPETPVAGTKDGATAPGPGYRYRSLGTNITCTAALVGEGLYRVSVDVNDTQVFRSSVTGANQYGPVYQNFRSSNAPMLRDGQTVQFAVATDKTSGEVIKLEVTLNVVK